MKKSLFLALMIGVLGFIPVMGYRLERLKTPQEANEWLECALWHNPEDVYGGLGPYSRSALDHAQDALDSGANANGHWEENGRAYLVGLDSDFTALLLRYGANPDIDNGAALKDAREKNTPDGEKVVQLLLMASKNKKKRRTILRTIFNK